ncbi:YccT family protein [Ferrimonas aestuarii]|uniref:DUF2057 domain-containing protein n=1 Tax=Ferrimonas aestuarii TaxID=2569539 RepID=A0A4U1BXV4_9GAMM|nr:DUF2057 domain-containing protein [Ferrimonas aestuarii]TKB58565.1 DUF2057 domain-containing protein [Ferrimonas aestuarii]
MKLASILAALVAGGISFGSVAAELNIPLSFEFVAVNGEEVESNFFSHKDELEVGLGQHTVALVYKDLIEERYGDGHQKVTSAPFLLHINVDADTTYTIRPSERITEVKQAKAFADKPTLTISRADGKTADYRVEMTSIKQESLFETLTKGVSPEQEQKMQVIAATNPNAAPAATAAVTTSAVAASAPSKTSVDLSNDTQLNPNAMLKYWWQQADEKTRKEFMSWAIQNM